MSKDTKNTLTLDVDKYQHYLDNSDMTDSEKLEFMKTLWNLLYEFVMIGFEVHPVQQALQDKNSGQTKGMDCANKNLDSSVIESKGIKNKYNTSVKGE